MATTYDLFTPIVPTLAGVAVSPVTVSQGDVIYAYAPISQTMRTLFVITNANATDPNIVTVISQPDEWDNTPSTLDSDLNRTIMVAASTTVITGPWMFDRWADQRTTIEVDRVLTTNALYGYATLYYDTVGWPYGEEESVKAGKKSRKKAEEGSIPMELPMGGLKVSAAPADISISVINVPNASKY